GTVSAWGRNNSGQSDVPAGLSNIIAISAGYEHNIALQSNGTLMVWGAGLDGQTNTPAGISNVLAFAAGKTHNVAILPDDVPAPPLFAQNPIWTNGVFSVSVQTRIGKAYRLECKDNLSDPTWIELNSRPGDGSIMSLSEP